MKLKTRTNQPVYYKLPVSSDIQHMSDDLLNSLRVGDVVQKKTGNQKHCYIVTYKEEKKGICLTYCDGSGYIETISYDYTGGHWVYADKDVFNGTTLNDVKSLIEGGTVSNAKPLYFHPITIFQSAVCILTLIIINNSETPFTQSTLPAYLLSAPGRYLVNGAYHTATYYLSPSYVASLDNYLYLIGIDNNGDIHGSSANVINFADIVNSATINDSVNKIN